MVQLSIKNVSENEKMSFLHEKYVYFLKSVLHHTYRS